MASKKGKARQIEESDDEIEDGTAAALTAKVDPAHRNKPIQAQTASATLVKVASELKQAESAISSTLDDMTSVATELAELHASGSAGTAAPGEEKDPERIAELDVEFRKALDKIAELKIRQTILTELKGKVTRQVVTTDLIGAYQADVVEPLAEYQKKTPRQRYINSKPYTDFRGGIFSALHDGMPIPNIKTWLPAQEGDDEDDDDFEVGATKTELKCPLTAMYLEDPVTSKKCPHSFSSKAIKEYIEKYEHTRSTPAPPKGSAICPAGTCSKVVSWADFAPDKNLSRRVADHIRREEEARAEGRGGDAFEVLDSDDED